VQIARWLVAFVCLLGVGGFIADFAVWQTARQHMRNPAWPQHAKFHNAQTMLMGIGLGLLGGLILFASRPLKTPGLLLASGAASLYWVSMVLAPLFPGTAWSDPEFRTSTPLRSVCIPNSCWHSQSSGSWCLPCFSRGYFVSAARDFDRNPNDPPSAFNPQDISGCHSRIVTTV